MLKKISLFLIILIISSTYVFAQLGEGGSEGGASCPDPNSLNDLSDADFKNEYPQLYESNPNCLTDDQMIRAHELGLDKGRDLGPLNPQEVQKFGAEIGQDWSNYVSFEGVNVNEDGTLSNGNIVDKKGNTFSGAKSIRQENGVTIADFFTFLAKATTELITYSNVDGTKIRFNVPAGGSVTMINNDDSFETTSSPGVESEIISKCPGPLIYSALEQDSRLSITKNLNSIYEFSYGALEFDANGKKQLLRTERTSKAEIDPCQGFVCITLAPEAKFDNEEQLDSLYLENPETGKDYTFCLEKKEGDGYKTLNQFTLNGIINFMNYEKSKLYTGTDPDTTATFTIQDGIARNFKVENKKDSLVSYTFPSESFTIQEEKERYVIHEPLLKINSEQYKTYLK